MKKNMQREAYQERTNICKPKPSQQMQGKKDRDAYITEAFLQTGVGLQKVKQQYRAFS